MQSGSRKSMLRLAAVGTSGLALTVGGCQQNRTERVREGQSTFEVLAPRPESGRGELAPTAPAQTEFVEAIPAYVIERECAAPVYPARALAANFGAREVVVTVSFDEKGNATDVAPSLLRSVIVLDDLSDEFFAAVKTAVLKWKISPPRNVHFRRERNGEKTYLRTETLATAVDIRFRFEASGTVRPTN